MGKVDDKYHLILDKTKEKCLQRNARFGESRLEDFLRFFGSLNVSTQTAGKGPGLKKGVLLGPAWLPPYTSFLHSPPPFLFFHQLRKEGEV